MTAWGNGDDGVIIENGATSNTVGGTSTIERNVISANESEGIHANAASGNTILADGDGNTSNTISQSATLADLADAPFAVDDTRGLDFDGIDDYVTIADSPSLTVNNAVTIKAWIKPDASANVNRMIINKEGEYEVALFPDDSVAWAFDNLDPDWSWHNTGYQVPNGRWTHLAVSYDNGTVSTYVNGTLDRKPRTVSRNSKAGCRTRTDER